jgi:hypothetical protein
MQQHDTHMMVCQDMQGALTSLIEKDEVLRTKATAKAVRSGSGNVERLGVFVLN